MESKTVIVGKRVINKRKDTLKFDISNYNYQVSWEGGLDTISYNQVEIQDRLFTLDKPCYVVKVNDKIGITNEGHLSTISRLTSQQTELLAFVPSISVKQLAACRYST